MAKYIKKEMPDLNGTGKTYAYYSMQTYRNIGMNEFVEKCAMHGGPHRGDILAVLSMVTQELSHYLAEGFSVTIDGLGTFGTKLGMKKDKTPDSFAEGMAEHNARSLRVSGISFRADKRLVAETDKMCELERAGEARLARSKYSEEERLAMAKDYLAEHRFMRVGDYAALTGLSYSSASLELRRHAADPASGIVSQGRKSAKLYLPKEART